MDATHSFTRRARSLLAPVLPVLALAAALAGLPDAARASSLQAAPVSISFDPTTQAQALQLTNAGTEPVEAQVRVQRWSQRNGADQLEPATDIVATPAIVKIAPGQRQVVRLVRNPAVPPAHEQAYRVLVDELPDKVEQDGDAGLQVLLRYSIPVFVATTAAPAAPRRSGATPPPLPQTDLSAVRAQLAAAPGGGTELRVRNTGPTHVRISRLALQSGNSAPQPVVAGLVGYVLPGQQMAFPVALPAAIPAGQTLKARFNDDREAQPVPLDRVGP
ncbi:MAG: molecular chaperone [Pseudoxanthomonas sp.]|nr:molecular chaperone [Pseudoxanthomonas sp.]